MGDRSSPLVRSAARAAMGVRLGMEVMLLALLVAPAVQARADGFTHANHSENCAEALTKLCPERHTQPKRQCQVCAGIHQHALRVAECTPENIRKFCGLRSTCGAVPLSCAPNCASAIVKSLVECSALGGGTVTLSAGIYHCNDTAAPDYQPMLHLEGLQDVALVGATGSGDFHTAGPDPAATTLLFHGMTAAFEIGSSSNIMVQNIQIDMVRQPYTFGKATAVTATSFTMQFDPEAYPFPQPVPKYLLKVQAIMGFDTTHWRMAHNPVDIYATSEPYNLTLDGDGLLTVHHCGSENNIRIGDSYILRHQVYSLNGFSFQNCSDVELQGVQIFSIPGMGFYMGQVHNAHLKECGVRRRPGRPMSITADASHFNECSGYLHLEGVHMEGQVTIPMLHEAEIDCRGSDPTVICKPPKGDKTVQGDDGCNIHGMFHDVRDIGDGSTFELGSRPAGGISQMNIGGRYEFRNRNNWTIEGVGTCTATSIVGRKQHATFEFEDPHTAISKFALLTDISLEPSVLIESSFFGNNRARGTLIKTSNVVVKDSVYNATSDHCILAFPDGCYWFESNGFSNWSVLNNTFIGCGAGSTQADIFVAACAPIYNNGLPTKNGNPIQSGQPFTNGRIVANRFVQPGPPHQAVQLYGFDGLVVQDNVLTNPPAAADPVVYPPGISPQSRSNTINAEDKLCNGLCSSFDGFDVSQSGAVMNGWVVDTDLTKNISSYIALEVDGEEVMTALADGLRPDLVGPVCKEPQHGFNVKLPEATATKLLEGNHTLAVFALRQDNSRVMVNKNQKLYCVNHYRQSCAFPQDCSCGAPLPSRLFVSNSVSCLVEGNTCEGKPCSNSEPTNGCMSAPGGARK